MKKTEKLRKLIINKPLEYIMEAHNAISAKIVEEAGFKGIWASGLSMSAALGVRDNNEASWTQILDVIEFMSDITSIPILLDGDTGYGNFNNARRLVKKLEQRDIAGVCIEDKLFPKTNSFIRGEAQPLAEIDEFCGKIKAMKDSQIDENFVVVSRVEAFIAGWGLEEALKRADAYRKAGADAILIHSKRADFTEIESFMNEWGNRHPVVIVPTKYFSVPTETFRKHGINLAIWANHNLRAAITAMQQTSRQIFHDNCLMAVEEKVSPVEEVFRLQGEEELALAEKNYLKSANIHSNSIILAKHNESQPLLPQQINQLKAAGVKEVITMDNAEGELSALYKAIDYIGENTIVSSSNIIFKPHVLQELLEEKSEIAIVADADYEVTDPTKMYISADKQYSRLLYGQSVHLTAITNTIDGNPIHGEFIGLWKISGNGKIVVKNAVETLFKQKDANKHTLFNLFSAINFLHPITVKYIKGSWLDTESYKKMQAGEIN